MKKLSATTPTARPEVTQHRARVRLGHEEQEQPADPLANEEGDAREAVGQVQRLGAAEPLDVLGRLLLEDVGDVVLGDDAEEVVLVVDDRDREQVPLGEQVAAASRSAEARTRTVVGAMSSVTGVVPDSAAAGTATARRSGGARSSTT
jgi:hypothetical protein